jgi:chemotaxis protein methyltransferase CheR
LPNLARIPHPLDGEIDSDHLRPADFERIAALIGREVGIRLPPAKRLMVEGRLRRRVRARGFDTFDEYCRDLFHGDGLKEERTFLINAVTTNKTDFFREPQHFDFLTRSIVPTLLAARRGERQPLLKLWSAASSTGAEAYTIAMLLADLAAQRRDFRFAVLGTDVSTAVLNEAERAIYPVEMIAAVPAEMQGRHILRPRSPRPRPEVRIAPEIRRQVRFAHLNLMDAKYEVDHDVDVIFLRNVLIYFERRDQEAVINRLVGHLRPGGYLLLGHSESMIGGAIAVRQVAPAVFQKS